MNMKKIVRRINQREIKDNKQNKPNETTSSKQTMYMARARPDLLKLVFDNLIVDRKIIDPPLK